jgi:hypothetical protein
VIKLTLIVIMVRMVHEMHQFVNIFTAVYLANVSATVVLLVGLVGFLENSRRAHRVIMF